MHVSSRRLRLTAATLPLLTIACSNQSEPSRSVANPARYAEIRSDIRSNLHFNPHCWCLAAESTTTAAVRARVTALDVPVLIDLLTDPDRQVQLGARGTLVRLGPEAAPALKAAVASRGPSSYEADQALLFMEISSKE